MNRSGCAGRVTPQAGTRARRQRTEHGLTPRALRTRTIPEHAMRQSQFGSHSSGVTDRQSHVRQWHVRQSHFRHAHFGLVEA